MKQAINIVFDGPPGPVSGRFIEVELDDGSGVDAGEWVERADGHWALRVSELPQRTLPESKTRSKCSCDLSSSNEPTGPERDCPEHGDVRLYAQWLDQACDAYDVQAADLRANKVAIELLTAEVAQLRSGRGAFKQAPDA